MVLGLTVIADDVASSYIKDKTVDKIYEITGRQFGNLAGLIPITVKVLYGLQSSGGMWYQKFSNNLQEMGFRTCKVDFYIWMRSCQGHYKYVAFMVDDLLYFSNNLALIIKPLKEI